MSNVKQQLSMAWRRTLAIARGVSATALLLASWLVLALFLVVVMLSMPVVQTRLVQYANTELTKVLKHPVSVEYVNITWFNTLLIKNVQIRDSTNQHMIAVGQMRVSFKMYQLLRRNIVIKRAELDSADVMMRTDLTGRNQFVAFVDHVIKATKPSDTIPQVNPPIFSIEGVTISNSRFRFWDERKKPPSGQYDYYHVDLHDINADVSAFRQRVDTVQMRIANLSARGVKDRRLPLYKLNANLHVDKNHIRLTDLDAEIGQSRIGPYFEMVYKEGNDWGDFNHRITMKGRLVNSLIHPQDIAAFAEPLYRFKDPLQLSGKFQGTVADLQVTDIQARMAQCKLAGQVAMQGLPDWNQTQIQSQVTEAVIHTPDLQPYVPTANHPTLLAWGTIMAKGDFKGTPLNYVTNIESQSALGTLNLKDLAMHWHPKHDSANTYAGEAQLVAFDAGKLANLDWLKKVSVDAKFSGGGYEINSQELSLEGDAKQVDAWGYNYHNINFNTKLKKGQGEGNFSIDDPYLSLMGQGKLDLRQGHQRLQTKGVLASAHLQRLGFVNQVQDLFADFDLDISDFDPNKMEGHAIFRQAGLTLNKQNVNLPDITIAAKNLADNKREITLDSELADVRISGSYQLTETVQDLQLLYQEYLMALANDSVKSASYYAKNRKMPSYDFDVEADLFNIIPLVKPLYPQFYISKDASIDLAFNNGNQTLIQGDFLADSLMLSGQWFYKNELDMVQTKDRTQNKLVANIDFSSLKQQIKNLPLTENANLKTTWLNNHIDFKASGNQIDANNYLAASGEIDILKDRLLAKLLPSELKLIDQTWRVEGSNAISIYSAQQVHIADLALASEKQRFDLNGWLSTKREDSLLITVNAFRLGTLNPFLPVKMKGTADARVVLRSVFKDLLMTGKLDVQGWHLDKFLVGNLYADAQWKGEQAALFTNAEVWRGDTLRMATVDGTYKPDGQILDMVMHLKNTRVQFLEAFMGGYITKVGGYATGDIKIDGSASDPNFAGLVEVKEGTLVYNYLNVPYTFNDKIQIKKNAFVFDNLAAYDQLGNKCVFRKGRIRHKFFQDWSLDFDISARNFTFFATTNRDNPLYYGTALGSGRVTVVGPLDNLAIRGDVTTEKGTHLHLPLSGYKDDTRKQSFIVMYDSRIKDTTSTQKKKVAGQAAIKGLLMDFNVNLTTDAEGELIFNEKAGEAIKVKGEGSMKLSVDTRGDFLIFGTYTINQGTYNFVFNNLFSKLFNISRGSTITWNGGPLTGVMNLEAWHDLNASLAPIIPASDSSTANLPEVRRKYPVAVRLNLRGDLMSPTIGLGVKIKEYPRNIEAYVSSFQALVDGNDQIMKEQVVSLFFNRSFLRVDRSNLTADLASGAAANTLSELVSNQISNWVSKVDPTLSLSIDVNGLDANSFRNANLSVSKVFFDGKLRVIRDGGFVNQRNEATAASIAGNWTVEYLLNRSGSLKAKAFHRNNPNQFVTSLNQNNTQQGLSLLNTFNFDRISDIWTRRKQIKIAESPVTPEK